VVYRDVMGRMRIAMAGGAVAVLVAAGVVGYQLLAPHPHPAALHGAAAMSVGGALTPSPSPSPPRVAGSASHRHAVPAPLKVATIGDSIMSGHGLDPAQAWPVLLGARESVAVSNLGCGGAGFIAVGECDTDYSGLVAEAAAEHPDVVIIQSSDNDFGEDDDDIASATTATVASLRTALPNARIIGFSTLWDQPGELPDQVASTSDDLRSAVEAVGGTFIDLGQPLADQAARDDEYDDASDDPSDGDGDSDDGDGPTSAATPAASPSPMPRMLQDDFEHPTAAGQQLLAEAIEAALEAAGIHL
jgi:acyl-CoA thioesterase I